MIFCSGLPNDRDMIRALGSLAVPLPLFTDCCFPSADNGLVCIERKKIGDMVQCINDGRFLNQMITCKEYGADYLFLVLEGRYRRNPEDGVLEIPVWIPFLHHGTNKRRQEWVPVKPAMQFSRFDQYLTELVRDAGIVVKHSENVAGTADVILATYQNFQTPSREHQSLKQMFKPSPPTVQLVRPSLVRRVASELPGIGWERSKVVAEHFSTVLAMAQADWLEWAELGGIGKKTALRVVTELGGDVIVRTKGKDRLETFEEHCDKHHKGNCRQCHHFEVYDWIEGGGYMDGDFHYNCEFPRIIKTLGSSLKQPSEGEQLKPLGRGVRGGLKKKMIKPLEEPDTDSLNKREGEGEIDAS